MQSEIIYNSTVQNNMLYVCIFFKYPENIVFFFNIRKIIYFEVISIFVRSLKKILFDKFTQKKAITPKTMQHQHDNSINMYVKQSFWSDLT